MVGEDREPRKLLAGVCRKVFLGEDVAGLRRVRVGWPGKYHWAKIGAAGVETCGPRATAAGGPWHGGGVRGAEWGIEERAYRPRAAVRTLVASLAGRGLSWWDLLFEHHSAACRKRGWRGGTGTLREPGELWGPVGPLRGLASLMGRPPPCLCWVPASLASPPGPSQPRFNLQGWPSLLLFCRTRAGT